MPTWHAVLVGAVMPLVPIGLARTVLKRLYRTNPDRAASYTPLVLLGRMVLSLGIVLSCYYAIPERSAKIAFVIAYAAAYITMSFSEAFLRPHARKSEPENP
mgnify:CR=1 FL=1